MQIILDEKSIKIAVMGLGYVGLPLAVEFGKIYNTYGYDINKDRITDLNKGKDKTLEITIEEISASKHLNFTTNQDDLKDCNIYIITVPTPIDKFKRPDLSFLSSASKTVGKILTKGNIVIFESTVYPGATEEYCVPIIEEHSGFQYNKDFFCGYSPERINPGDNEHTLTTVKKITSGSNEEMSDLVDRLYSKIVKAGTFKASSIRVAEAAKVIENIQRDINIALINELARIFDKLELNTSEILAAAGSKWNFLPFSPGLVGGHCIGVDPYYLTHLATKIGYYPEMILAGRRINDSMGAFIADRTLIEIAKAGMNAMEANIFIFGVTFKEDCPDIRNTKVPSIIDQLTKYGCKVNVTDPYIDPLDAKKYLNIDLMPEKNIKQADVIIVAVGHSNYKEKNSDEWKLFFKQKGIFIDVKGITENKLSNDPQISYWRL